MLLRTNRQFKTLLSLSLPTLVATMTTQAAPSYPTLSYTPRHFSFPYTSRDFLRQDEDEDTDFYSSPRFVTHIDDNAIRLLREYYEHNLPRKGRILDFCSSWISHFPPPLEATAIEGKKENREGVQVIGMGMNAKELAANPILLSTVLQDLNKSPQIPAHIGKLDAATCVVSIDYLIRPLEVLSSLRERMRPGGKVHLIISNRCFPTKAVGRWLRVGEQERLMMVGDYLWFSGWKDVEILTLSDGKAQGESTGLGSFFGFLGRVDPLWVVRGTAPPEGDVLVREEL